MSSYFNVDLSNVFNHKVIGEAEILNNNSSLSNLGLDGNFFRTDAVPNSLEIIRAGNIPYIFPDKSPESYDNITCEGQTIAIPQGKFSRIFVLGFSEWGDFSEKIKLQFENNISEKVDVFFLNCWWSDYTDWWRKWSWECEAKKVCDIALTAITTDSSIYRIYYNKYNINNSSEVICSIELPCNPLMHIFAITLERSDE